MRIMSLDPATTTGWAFYDTTSTVSSIECGSIWFDGDGAFEKVRSVRNELPPLIKKYQPEFIVFESPLSFIKAHKKVGKSDLLGGVDAAPTMNPGTVMQLNRISGAVQAIIEGFRIACEEVGPKTWQSIIPSHIRGNTKDRARQYCDQLQIIGKNNDARDAALIALWAAHYSQTVKLMIIEKKRTVA